MKNKGKLVISLDFELLWGMRDKRTIDSYGKNILGGRDAVSKMLDIFTEFNVVATFATVGFLFAKDKKELVSFSPESKPKYDDKNLSGYNGHIDLIGDNESEDKYHYASSLIDLVKKYPNQEIASHTFCHYYCLESGQDIVDFKQDMTAAIAIAEKQDIKLRSLVFPRNQYNKEYLEVCKDLGITSYRGNEKVWFNKAESGQDETIFKRGFRLLDSYINISGHHSFSINDIEKTIPYNIPSSRFLRAYSPKLKSFDTLKLNRILKSMTHAAKNDEIYHLWWHPHNFGSFQDENFNFLRKILNHYKALNLKYGFGCATMKDIASEIKIAEK